MCGIIIIETWASKCVCVSGKAGSRSGKFALMSFSLHDTCERASSSFSETRSTAGKSIRELLKTKRRPEKRDFFRWPEKPSKTHSFHFSSFDACKRIPITKSRSDFSFAASSGRRRKKFSPRPHTRPWKSVVSRATEAGTEGKVVQ